MKPSRKIYYSGSMSGAKEVNIQLPIDIVEYLEGQGHNVLSRHVAFMHQPNVETPDGQKFHVRESMLADFAKMTRAEIDLAIRAYDLADVEAAEYFIALVNAPSHGVGMEIQHALLRPRLGLSPVPMLLLIDAEKSAKISPMLGGICKKAHPIEIYPYRDLADIKQKLKNFIK
ncbi:MAG: hypothetical protein FWD15_00860 [Alphaproteobacteria bacterium]|nr:hypothetical protein [Alphaproteobacteria bacterium]